MMRAWGVVGLVALVSAGVKEDIRWALQEGEAALQASRWQAATVSYALALRLVAKNALKIDAAAESRLYNNLGWAAYHLRDYASALRHYEAGARACAVALHLPQSNFSECLDKVYENMNELVHGTLRNRPLAIAKLREGLAAARRAAERRGVDEADLSMTVRVRLGQLLVFQGDLDEAEATLRPLVAAALRASVDEGFLRSAEHPWAGTKRLAVVGEALVYTAWSRAFRRDWTGASDALALAAAVGLPRNATGCAEEAWRVQEGWRSTENDPGWAEYTGVIRSPKRDTKDALHEGFLGPWCLARNPGDDAGARRDCANAVGRAVDVEAYARVVQIRNAHLAGREASALWVPAPRCVFFTGEHTVGGSLPTDWGLASLPTKKSQPSPPSRPPPIQEEEGKKEEEDPLMEDHRAKTHANATTARPVNHHHHHDPSSAWALAPPAEDVTRRPCAILVTDQREGHTMFWHHQMETLSRVALALERRGLSRVLPAEVRRELDEDCPLLYPSALAPTLDVLARHGHQPTLDFKASGRLEPYDPAKVYAIDRAYLIDWTTASTTFTSRSKIKENADTDWLAAAALASAPLLRRYTDSIFSLHHVPAAILRHQRAFLRRVLGANYSAPTDPPAILFYSRADCDRRHVEDEEAFVAALERRFPTFDVIVWRGGTSPDIERAARDWSRAAIVVGPNGAGLANMIHCSPGTHVIFMAIRDDLGSPSPVDDYYSNVAAALNLKFKVVTFEHSPRFFANYSLTTAEINAAIDTLHFTFFHQPQPP